MAVSNVIFASLIFVGFDFSPKDDNLGVLKSIVWHVYVGGWVGVGACSTVEGRRPGRIRRRPARSPGSEFLYQFLFRSDTPPPRSGFDLHKLFA